MVTFKHWGKGFGVRLRTGVSVVRTNEPCAFTICIGKVPDVNLIFVV